jgi:thioredoxin-related protein
MVVSESRGQEVAWRPFEEAIAAADSTDRFVMVAVYAPWCGWCHKMKKEVYSSEEVRRCLTDNFVSTRLNRDDTDETYRYRGRRITPRRLASTFRVDSVPATVLLSPRGEYLLHLSGFIEPEPLRAVLGFVSTHADRKMTLAQYRAQTAAPCGERRRSE